ncbi:hypothetical protein [Photobacterium sp. TY1-4]|uniref:hypothetical protein n=1 Tax=Photobacterium sp. TY1-4 TaxID=2899122 RepID=UPI0021BEA224|nr:hypothetical protein [Photobacterium sp. TY1-4]UXI01125.1 hypothetical protein NH461_15380 [Photobacterium sp. TY1-4]
MRKANSKGMLPNGRAKAKDGFVKALHKIFDHEDYQSLSHSAQSLLWLLARQYNGFNNGSLTLALSVVGKWGWKKKLLQKCRDELIAKDWIRISRTPAFPKQRTLYALSWQPIDEVNGITYDDGVLGQKLRSLRF